MTYDCQRCGACCKNPPDNVAEAFTSWVEVEPADRIRAQPELMRRLVVEDADGVPHLRLAPDGRCLALRGSVGARNACTIYHHRPSPCRRVQPGDASCVRARAAHELPI